MDRLHSVYPFIRWCTCGLFASLGYYEERCTEDSHASFVWTPVSVLLGLRLGGELLGHMLTLFNFWGTATHFLLAHQRPCKALKTQFLGPTPQRLLLLCRIKAQTPQVAQGRFSWLPPSSPPLPPPGSPLLLTLWPHWPFCSLNIKLFPASGPLPTLLPLFRSLLRPVLRTLFLQIFAWWVICPLLRSLPGPSCLTSPHSLMVPLSLSYSP